MIDFLEEIYKLRSFKNDIVFKRKIKRYRKACLTFSIFQSMIKAIQELELAFLYENSPQDSDIYTFEEDNSGMTLTTLNFDYTDSLITIQLERVKTDDVASLIPSAGISERTNIIIKRKLGGKIESRLRYKYGDAELYMHNRQDMMLYKITKYRIMNSFCDLLEYFYYNGPHRSIDPRLL